jgi:hypothetical protein
MPLKLLGVELLSSENFLGPKYCDNTHNIVTIHTIFILYKKMNNNKKQGTIKQTTSNEIRR